MRDDVATQHDFVRRGNTAKRINGEFRSVEDTLSKLGLIARDGILANAAVELFCQGDDTFPRIKLDLLAGNTTKMLV